MNILYICDEYPPGKNGGIGTVVQILGRELVRQGHKVFVAGLYAYHYGENDYEEDQGVRVWRMRYGLNLGKNPNSIPYKIFRNLPDLIKGRFNGEKAFHKYIDFIRRMIDREHIDVIEIADYNTFVFNIGVKIEWPEFKAPLVLKSHGSYTKICHDLGIVPQPRFSEVDFLLYKRADALAAVSRDTATTNEFLFHTGKHSEVLYNGIALPPIPYGLPRRANKVIYTGALTRQKGIYQLIKAWESVHKQHSGVKLLVYGKGDRAPLLKMLSRSARSSVQFLGHVPRHILFTELANATMAVFPSYSESFSMAPLEAMAVGCPVIYTSRSSGKEIISDLENGLLVDPDNVQELSRKILMLLEDETLRKKYSVNGRATIVNKFTIEKSAEHHIRYYSEIIKTLK